MPLTGGFSGAVQTQITFDNVRISLTASQTDETIPATGESDKGNIVCETTLDTADELAVSANSGTNFAEIFNQQQAQSVVVTSASVAIIGIGNSTGRYRFTMTATVGTRIIHQMITTEAEQ